MGNTTTDAAQTMAALESWIQLHLRELCYELLEIQRGTPMSRHGRMNELVMQCKALASLAGFRLAADLVSTAALKYTVANLGGGGHL